MRCNFGHLALTYDHALQGDIFIYQVLIVHGIQLFKKEIKFPLDFFGDYQAHLGIEVHDLFFEGAKRFFTCLIEELLFGLTFLCFAGSINF